MQREEELLYKFLLDFQKTLEVLPGTVEGLYVRISEDGEKFLKKGQMWMYRNNVIELDESLENGCVVDILTTTDEYLGTGFLSKLSHITVRILTKNRTEELNRTFFKNRIQTFIKIHF